MNTSHQLKARKQKSTYCHQSPVECKESKIRWVEIIFRFVGCFLVFFACFTNISSVSQTPFMLSIPQSSPGHWHTAPGQSQQELSQIPAHLSELGADLPPRRLGLSASEPVLLSPSSFPYIISPLVTALITLLLKAGNRRFSKLWRAQPVNYICLTYGQLWI